VTKQHTEIKKGSCEDIEFKKKKSPIIARNFGHDVGSAVGSQRLLWVDNVDSVAVLPE
jgi:hypothetical protein